MNIKKTILAVALLACITVSTTAQTANAILTTAEKQAMMLKVVELFEDYERYSGIDEDFSKYASSFRSLFVSGEAPVFNDIIGLAHDKSLPAKDYAKLMSEQSATTRVSISDIGSQSVFFDNGKWKMKCSFHKSVNITNKCGIEFSSDFFNENDYLLEATIVYDKETGLCQFERIDGTANAKRQLEKDFRVVQKTSDNDNEVLYNNNPLNFNAMGQAFISPVGKFTFPPDPEIVVKEVIDDEKCRLMHLKLALKSWRLKAHYDLGLGKAYDMEKGDELSSSDAKSNSLGLDLGYVFRTKSKLKIGLFTGVGMTMSSLDLAYANSDYSYNALPSADVDNDTYVRHYSNLSLSQKVKLTELNVPIYVDLGYHFNPLFSIYADLGVRLNLDMDHKVDATEGSADVYGVYPQYDNLLLDANWAFNGFGQQRFSNSTLLYADPIDVQGFTADLMGNFGFRFNIPNVPLSIDLGVSYLMGLTELVKTGTVIGRYSNTHLVYNVISGTSSTEHLHNLTEMLESVKRKQLRATLGIILKF